MSEPTGFDEAGAGVGGKPALQQDTKRATLRDQVEDLIQRRDRIRTQMGGLDKIDRQHARGRMTMRERIDHLLDPGSFVEIGTFARSEHPDVKDRSPGDGKISGFGKIDGRTVAVSGDDVTVFHGSSSVVGTRRTERVFDLARARGFPIIYLGETGGARLPDTLGSEGFSKMPGPINLATRRRAVPMATAIVGESFGGSSFEAALSDFVVQVRGTCLAVSSPRVIEIATTERVTFEELGGVEVHARITGQIDTVAEDEDDALRQIREFLGYMPDSAWGVPQRLPYDSADDRPNERLLEIIPAQRNRAYDMYRVIRQLVDGGRYLSLKPEFGQGLITCLARIGGQVVGILASQPLYRAGVLDPNACDKGTQFVCLCDSFSIPLLFLQDVPGFIVGKQPEHDRLLSKAIMFLQALAQAEVPKFTVVLRKAFGLAYFSLCGNDTGNDMIVAWPSAEISFMDPAVGVNVAYAEKLRTMPNPEEDRRRLTEEWERDTGPWGIAGIMKIDEVIDPRDTRAVLLHALGLARIHAPARGQYRPLASWPNCL